MLQACPDAVGRATPPRLSLRGFPALVLQERVPRERRQRPSVLQKKPQAEDWRTARAPWKGTGDNENPVRTR
ncbi:PHD finger protein 14 [Plecturocebus cupreus]